MTSGRWLITCLFSEPLTRLIVLKFTRYYFISALPKLVRCLRTLVRQAQVANTLSNIRTDNSIRFRTSGSCRTPNRVCKSIRRRRRLAWGKQTNSSKVPVKVTIVRTVNVSC